MLVLQAWLSITVAGKISAHRKLLMQQKQGKYLQG